MIGEDGTSVIRVLAPTAEDMRRIGSRLASLVRGGDVIVLSGPLGAGKTTFAQGFGRGLHIAGPIVSPTFTIARELVGRSSGGAPLRLVHVDAYRLGTLGFEPGQASADTLLDQLESLGLDEELDDPDEHTIVLMEWGSQMAAVLASARLEVSIERPLEPKPVRGKDEGCGVLSGDGPRTVVFRAVGPAWTQRMDDLRKAVEA
ncbi:tRNA (adenosine(37)-N6)-threonylcarbamoyltransferase complex ATPase subunit type 1 TsaE [Bifidobacterium xylocopae]|uniref:tRNA threonylcarbamoyladenosine biosynthesis protein TsaE n=1 Tax=Bifidobacterium xylocopae TaxID=2493119 RepID=A0A366KB76_9BIFI|nr:tRNA (adenosine(37)-N6)-threonylcarbamoyltransferase complex ATPase subunit type 1 TsaE [Bifidobacterium xylocopae]RBP98986.1 tRNA (adenosine(37)-N6)-threonylcarbamoyltransferase complex ATPase subunit type 1 TsaE [Bifidobacterium xylocopae]